MVIADYIIKCLLSLQTETTLDIERQWLVNNDNFIRTIFSYISLCISENIFSYFTRLFDLELRLCKSFFFFNCMYLPMHSAMGRMQQKVNFR